MPKAASSKKQKGRMALTSASEPRNSGNDLETTAAEEDEQARLLTLTEASAAQPLNTTKAYKAGRDEFIQFCAERHYADGNTVTGGSFPLLLHFLAHPDASGKTQQISTRPSHWASKEKEEWDNRRGNYRTCNRKTVPQRSHLSF